MRKLFTFLCLFLLGNAAYGGILQSSVFDAAGTNIATTYTLSGANSVSVPNGLIARQFCYLNTSASLVAFYVDNDLSAVAPTVDVKDIYAQAAMVYPTCLQFSRLTRTFQIRSGSGSSITTGKIYVWIVDGRG